VLSAAGIIKQPLRDAHDVTPQRLPLVILIPHIWPLKQRHDKPLGLHENHLWCTDLSLHRYRRSSHQPPPGRTLTYRPMLEFLHSRGTSLRPGAGRFIFRSAAAWRPTVSAGRVGPAAERLCPVCSSSSPVTVDMSKNQHIYTLVRRCQDRHHQQLENATTVSAPRQ
jgi:hypothetical protein